MGYSLARRNPRRRNRRGVRFNGKRTRIKFKSGRRATRSRRRPLSNHRAFKRASFRKNPVARRNPRRRNSGRRRNPRRNPFLTLQNPRRGRRRNRRGRRRNPFLTLQNRKGRRKNRKGRRRMNPLMRLANFPGGSIVSKVTGLVSADKIKTAAGITGGVLSAWALPSYLPVLSGWAGAGALGMNDPAFSGPKSLVASVIAGGLASAAVGFVAPAYAAQVGIGALVGTGLKGLLYYAGNMLSAPTKLNGMGAFLTVQQGLNGLSGGRLGAMPSQQLLPAGMIEGSEQFSTFS